MSWNNALPFWVYDHMHEHELARMSCAFESEWFSGTSKVLPKHVVNMSKATFSSYNTGSYNAGIQPSNRFKHAIKVQ